MFSHFYQKNIIEKPKLIFVFLLIFIASFGFNLSSFIKRKRIIEANNKKILNLNPEFKNKPEQITKLTRVKGNLF